ncbi:hypothetical protein ACFR9U_05845 [Halorientalis brevis]|uniref:Uncharacterized protein n=1 Tax=Halorientalis brevis TaxID=1126241 RepID=A0ABD6CAE2_9EURY|nr:hypothetical protein [Halorientalis brevis]
MAPRTTRRRYLGGLATLSLASLAGCIDSLDGQNSTPAANDTQPTTDSETTESDATPGDGSETGDSVAGSPKQVVRAYVEAGYENPTAVRQHFHPIHPFHPDNLSAEKAKKLLSSEGALAEIDLETRDVDVTPELVQSAPLLRTADVDQETLSDALAGEQTAVVETVVTTTDGKRQVSRIATVTTDGEWAILALRIDPKTTQSAQFEGRVVSKVSVDTEKDRVRLYFDGAPTAEELTAKTTNARSSRSSTTPGSISYFDLYPDPAGDELVVTATVDGDTRTIHREQYPPSERAVEDVTYDDDPESDVFDAAATVSFADDRDGERYVVESTIHGGSVTLDPDNPATAVVGVDPAADEVVVTRTTDGASDVVHRERHRF